ncbi:hypothetical protein [Mesorhizobium sp. YR577]|uniref:hypothetical protein n=1 Tax=Mesorhizobium sp. YR577 TaxID=1884373 RepID=UPI0008EC882C|nr:hypothetical protein [Mesorhizobium sp. YR577]SFU19000.1 hypothetical protein SAMN05518861_12049 [Mesorhizobium sp. YR577]
MLNLISFPCAKQTLPAPGTAKAVGNYVLLNCGLAGDKLVTFCREKHDEETR